MKDNFTILSEVHIEQSINAIVAMAIYKGDKLAWIQQAVTSLVTQSYQHHIIMIIIDGPVSDDVLTYLVNVSKPFNNILLARGISNVGLSACMNFAANWALVEVPNIQYFFRMDADDMSESHRLKTQVEYLDSNPKIDVLGSSLIEINEEGMRVGARVLPTNHGEIVRYLPRRCAINHPTVAMRMTIFASGFRYREDLSNTQDYFFWTDLVVAGHKFANLNDKLLRFRRVNDFYKRRGVVKSLNEFRARVYTMRVLKRFSLGNIIYACAVLCTRMLPSTLVKLAYKVDRYWLGKRVKQD